MDEALRWLAAERERPFFLWVHLYDPHTPYAAPREYAAQFPRTLTGAYDAEIAYADAQLGRVLDALEADGRLGRTVVAVLGDHGEMLGEHGEPTHGFFVYDSAVHIPLVVAAPGLAPRVVPDQVRIVDVMPTLLELLGGPRSACRAGHEPAAARARASGSICMALSESWFPRFHYGWSELRAIQDERFKLIRAPRRELYDLERDPLETADLAASDPRRVETLERALDERLAASGGGGTPKLPEAVDSETAERLEALGYIGGSVSARHLEDRPRGDPKDKIQLYNLLKQASTASAEGRFDEAIAKARQALAEDPEILEGHMLLGNFFKKAGRPDDAIAAYKRALALDPEHQETIFRLALAYKDEGRLDDARTGFERARALDPRNGRVLWQLADVEMRAQPPRRGGGDPEGRPFARGRARALPAQARRVLPRPEAPRRGGAGLPRGSGETPHARDRPLQPRPRLRGARPARAGDRRLREGARGPRQGLPRRLQPRQAAAASRPSARGARALPPGGDTRARVRDRTPLPRQGAARHGRPCGRGARGEGGAVAHARSRPWPRSATTSWPTSTTGRAA